MKFTRTLILLGAIALPSLVAAQSKKLQITSREIDAHLRFLASDLLEGRGSGTRGGRLTAEYIASQLQVFGVEPGVNGSYFQKVPVDLVTSDQATLKITASGKATGNLRVPEDIIVWAGSAKTSSEARAEVVFVGYGALAPEYRWDDFKNVDVRGKILLVLVNDPPAPASEPNLFGGKAMTYYGRWTYKFEEAERRGAAGMLVVHSTGPAGYPWQVLRSNIGTQRMLVRNPVLPPPIGVRGWITDSSATALLAQAGLNMLELRRQAESRDFRPVATGIAMDISFTNNVQRLESENVVGVVRGSDPKLRDEYVGYSAHWDHLGVGIPVNGDSIYNGAADNASGVATVLAIAHAAAHGPKPKRSQLFVFVTLEESGLLGSAYYGQHPTVPASRILAFLNIDNSALLGRFRDMQVLGDNKSSLGPSLLAMVRKQGIRFTPDAHPEAGHFYRSDHFSFAKAGIPAADIKAGYDFVGHPLGWGAKQREEYTAVRYHQPSDEYRADFDYSGAVQLAEIVYKYGQWLANGRTIPTWNADAEFRAAREASLKPGSR